MSSSTLTPAKLDYDAINRKFVNTGPTAVPTAVITWAAETFRDTLAMTSSFGAESALMLHLVTRIIPDIPVITLDTGYFFPETYLFMEALAKRLNLNLKVYQSPISPARMEAIHGKLWEQGKEGLVRYDRMRKVEPMNRAIQEIGFRGWLSGPRADQTGHRASMRHVEPRHDGICKIHPILGWTAREIQTYMMIHDLPFHPLVQQGYASIGDHHSTVPSEGRDGRFLGLKQECGLHLPDSKSEEQSREASDL